MTNLEAIAAFLRIEKYAMQTPCKTCGERNQWIRKHPQAAMFQTLGCAGCFTQNMAVLTVVSGDAMEETCNVAILTDLSIDPRHVMTIDKHAKLEEEQSNIKLDTLYDGAPDARPIIEDVLAVLREGAKNWQHPLFVHTALIRTALLIFAGLHWTKAHSMPVILKNQIKSN